MNSDEPQGDLTAATKAVQRESGWRMMPATVAFLRGAPLHQIQLDGDDGFTSATSLIGTLQTRTRVMCLVLPGGLIYITGVINPSPGLSGTLDAVDATTAGTLISGVSTETEITGLRLSASFTTGLTYQVDFQVCASVTVTADDWQIVCREDSTGGAVIGTYPFSGLDVIGTLRGTFFYRPLTTNTHRLLFLVAPRSVTGTVSILAGPGSGTSRTWTSVSCCGPVRTY